MAQDLFRINLVIGFYVLVLYLSDYSNVRQNKLASSLVNFWSHDINRY